MTCSPYIETVTLYNDVKFGSSFSKLTIVNNNIRFKMNVTSMNVTINLDDKDASVKRSVYFYIQFIRKSEH